MRKIFGVLTTSLLVLGLFACKNKETGFKPKYNTNNEYKINVAGHYKNFEALEDEIIRFKKYYPNAEIEYTYYDNYNNVITTALNSQTPPDIFFTVPWMINDSKYSELLTFTEDLSSGPGGIDISILRDEYITKNNNEIPMVPIFVTTYGMMVNEDLFVKENISIPKTYNELVDSCNAFKNKGYENVMMGHKSQIMYPMFFPHLCYKIKDNQSVINDFNDLKLEAGEHLRDSLNLVSDFMGNGFINLENCDALKNDYYAVNDRFFEGDIPMMLTNGQTFSGTEKRENVVEAFKKNPFKYSLKPVPSLDDGGVFLSSVNQCFSINKKSDNLEITNEFMRFLINKDELDNLAKIKRLISPAKDTVLDKMYASFGDAKALYISDLGLSDDVDKKMRTAGNMVAQGKMSINEAINSWTTLE